MKNSILKLGGLMVILVLIFTKCGTNRNAISISDKEKEAFSQEKGDTISIANEEVEYEILIIEPGFDFWLQSVAKQEGYYSQSFLEGRNRIYVINWNQRVLDPQRYSPNLYEMQIDYDSNVDYGYEVNYKLYNYFIYFQLTHNQKLAGYVPRI